jgi:hypothetical protein
MNVGTHMITDITQNSANGIVYCKAEFEQDGQWCEQAVLYRDRYVAVDGAWYFLSPRGHELWYGAPRATDPLTLSPAEWPKSNLGTGTVPGSWPSWNAFWAGAVGP